MPGALHAAFRRAEIAHGRIVSIDVAAALQCAGVRGVFTGDAFANTFGTIVPAINYAGRGGASVRVPDRPILARDRVRFLGEEIAVVLADTATQALDAAEQIQVIYESLPAVIGAEAALAPQACAVHASIPGNVCFDFDYGDEHGCDALLAEAAHRVRVTLASPRVSAAPLEPRAALAWFDPSRRTYELRCCNQGGGLMADQLAMLLKTDADRIRVHPVDVGGGFGPRAGAYPEYAILLELARQVGRPIQWISSRAEDFLCDAHGRGIRLRGELGLDRDGRFLALKTEWLCDQGAYLTQAGARTNTINGFLIGAGPYRVRALYGRHRLVMTNTTPTDAYRGAARPEAALVIERLVDEAARALGIDAMELRRRNAIERGALPYRTHTGSVIDSADFGQLLEAAGARSAWRSFSERRCEAAGRGLLRGIGMALFVEPCGGGFVHEDQVALLFEDQGRVLAYHGATSNGQGHETVFPAIVAARLGIEAERVTLRASDPDGPRIRGNGTIGSRSLLAQGSAFSGAADQAIKTGTKLAARLLEAAGDDIEFDRGTYRVRGTDRTVSIDQVMHAAASESPNPLNTIYAQPVPRTFTTGAHVAEVEIDRETGEVRLVSFTATDDIGTVFNATLAHGQIHGGVAQAAGQVLGECCTYDLQTGQLITGTFMDYAMPRADTLPAFDSAFASTPSATNALGAKGAGETGATGGLAAITNAVLDALHGAGVDQFELPATSDRVWAALERAAQNKGR